MRYGHAETYVDGGAEAEKWAIFRWSRIFAVACGGAGFLATSPTMLRPNPQLLN